MKFKLKPVTGMLVASPAASAYGCWSQVSDNMCDPSGTVIAYPLQFADQTTPSVTATVDWEQSTSVETTSGVQNQGSQGSTGEYFCHGPGKFLNPVNSHTESITFWEDNNGVGNQSSGGSCT